MNPFHAKGRGNVAPSFTKDRLTEFNGNSRQSTVRAIQRGFIVLLEFALDESDTSRPAWAKAVKTFCATTR